MVSSNEQSDSKQIFEPLEIMGWFWLFFGIVVLLATFFVRETENVPLVRGIVTNIFAAALLVLAGALSIIKGRIKKRRKKE